MTRLRPAGVDFYGNPDQSFATPDSLDLDAFVMFSSEGARFFLPPGADVVAGDRLVFETTTYEVHDAPKRVRSPSREVLTIANAARVAKE